MDNMSDWNAEEAKSYQRTMNMSLRAIRSAGFFF